MTRPAASGGGARAHVGASASGTSYDVVVAAGALDQLPDRLHAVAPARHYAVISDSNVAALYGDRVLRQLRDAGMVADLLQFDAGEAHKTRQVWAALTDAMFALGCGRDSCVIALGGGVTGDLAGFVAATCMRGVPVVQVPTSLLAMVDAAVGGKTGIDVPAGKNLVGAFHAPRLVLADPLLLRTLPITEIRAGLAEAIKHGAVLDAEYFDWIDAEADALTRLEHVAVERLVARSVELKAAVVTSDPHEGGYRAVLNFGHTVGHALELLTAYELSHGDAVSMGMVAESWAGELAGVTDTGTTDRLASVLRRCGLPVGGVSVTFDDVMGVMRLDKKARGSIPRFTLPLRIGSCARASDGSWTHEVDAGVLRDAFCLIIRGDAAV
ncbi:3-dehydroquinate synthase [soil metagenome]